MSSTTDTVSLRPYNTFGLDAEAQDYAIITNEQELQQVLQTKQGPWFILGGGSNLLFTQNPTGTVLHNAIKGIKVTEDDEDYVRVRFGGGEIWHETVMWAIENGYGGIENLSLIPGTIGAAPIQNIGAYGVELKEVFYCLEATHLETGVSKKFYSRDCEFGYRSSVFKGSEKGKWFITHVTLQLRKQPEINVAYGAIQEVLDQAGIEFPTIADVSNAVIAIRQSKLPDPKVIGNAGSFFKNPEIDKARYDALQQQYPGIPGYTVKDGLVKVPAGWLIEQAGWKGFREGQYGVHARQALVLVNYGGASGRDIASLAQRIIADITLKFGIALEPEVNIV